MTFFNLVDKTGQEAFLSSDWFPEALNFFRFSAGEVVVDCWSYKCESAEILGHAPGGLGRWGWMWPPAWHGEKEKSVATGQIGFVTSKQTDPDARNFRFTPAHPRKQINRVRVHS